MNRRQQYHEKGQIIIVLALGLVALLGLTALAIDGSMIYNERRTDQSTADSAALAGAGAAAQAMKNSLPSSFYCGSSLGATATAAAVAAAVESATEDNVTLAINDFSSGNGVQVTCGKDQFATYLDVRVMVTTTINTSFARAVGTRTLSTKVESTARVYPKQPAAYGNAIVSLSNSCGNIGGIDFGGSSTVKINKGGVWSNSCLGAGGNSSVTISGGVASYYTSFSGGCPSNISSDITDSTCPQKVTTKLPDLNIKVPTCPTNEGAYGSSASSGTINPGNYLNLDPSNKDPLTLKPGLYCLWGDFNANSKAVVHANGVTIVFMNGTTKFNGGAELHLMAPNCETIACGVPPAVRGLLIYIPPSNQATVTLNGGSENEFVGTIFGPTSNFKINGGSISDTFNTQIIGNKVDFIGNSNMYMNLEGAELYQQPAWVELLK